MLIRIVVGALLIFSADSAFAYTNFIGYGYTSCITCHYNPFGNGPLTDYGRALGATTIAARPFVAPKMTDEELGKQSGFLFHKPLPPWLRLQTNFRGLYVARQLESNVTTRFVAMRADGTAILQFLENRLFVSGTMGFVPDPSSTRGRGNLISREHVVGYRPIRNLGFYAGKTDVVFGVRIVDHDAYSRSRTKLSYNDQTYGIVAHVAGKKFEAGVHLQAGNLLQPGALRQKGFSATLEYDLLEKFRVGGSFLFTSGTYRKRIMGAHHIRLGVGEGNSVIAELGFINENITGGTNLTGAYILAQTMTNMMRGLNFLLTFENYTENIFGSAVRFFRIGPAIQYFPWQRLEIRTDFQAERQWARDNGVDPDSLRVMTQVSLWF